jgi:IS605 OrfB family transposase
MRRKYALRWKRKPTFTMPSVAAHPAWYVFKKDATYKSLDLQNGSVLLKVLESADDPAKRKAVWKTFCFRGDARLKAFTPKQVKGVKLIYPKTRGGERDLERPYLYFSVEVPEEESRIPLAQSAMDKYGANWARNEIKKSWKEKEGKEPPTLAVDLGARHAAVCTVRKEGKITKTVFIRTRAAGGGKKGASRWASLRSTAGRKREISALRSETGRPPRDALFAAARQKHVDGMGEDRYKKVSRSIVALAKEHGADIVVFENLAGFAPSVEKARGVNKTLMAWNRRKIVEFTKWLASVEGVRVAEVNPKQSSQVCNRCGKLGARFHQGKGEWRDGRRGKYWYWFWSAEDKEKTNDVASRKDLAGKQFVCLACRYVVNADFNASVNLHKIFWGEFSYPTEAEKEANQKREAEYEAFLKERAPKGR